MGTNGRSKSNERYHIRAVARALLLLKTFLADDAELSASEISKRIQLDPSTTFRMLVTLEDHDFIRQDPATGKYRLGVVCLELGSQFLKRSDVRTSAVDAMRKLRDEFGETLHLGTLEGDQIVYLEKVTGSHAIGLMSSRVGGRAPAHATAIGKVMLAFLPDADLGNRFPSQRLTRYTPTTITDLKELEKEIARVRANMHAIDNQEFEPGVKCVAAPVFSHKGIAAALSISGPAERMEEHIRKHRLVQSLQNAVSEISTEMGWGRGVDQMRNPGRGDGRRRQNLQSEPAGKPVKLRLKRQAASSNGASA